MARKKITSKHSKKTLAKAIPKRIVREYTQQEVDNVLFLKFHDNLSLGAIATRLNIPKATIHNMVERNVHRKEEFKTMLENALDKVKKREELPTLARIEKLVEDSTQVIELSIALMRERLMGELNALHDKDIDEGRKSQINNRELKEMLEVVMPYVIEKKSPLKDKSKPTEKPRGQLFNLMKKQA